MSSINELAEKYHQATETFLNLAKSLSKNDLDKSDHEGWTPRQVIHHMADSEAQSFSRLRRLIAEPGSVIQGYDEAKWANSLTLGYSELPVADSLEIIAAVRKASYELVKRLTPEQLEITGVHSESGIYSVLRWIEIYSRHPIDHANQIKNQI
ncbi:MAG: DinB family protein [Actinomycetota bacterium]